VEIVHSFGFTKARLSSEPMWLYFLLAGNGYVLYISKHQMRDHRILYLPENYYQTFHRRDFRVRGTDVEIRHIQAVKDTRELYQALEKAWIECGGSKENIDC
jgi:hypothetical protein